ncbi:MAG: hypothetical protein QG552_822 [Thermodesulfobacteriota bacterium]|nr:hypothetical protein [Thermodesulfobacteriota bacterium]
MGQPIFTKQDVKQIEGHGLTLAEVKRQLDLFNAPRPFLKLTGPCTVGDGIRTFDRKRRDVLVALYEREGRMRRCVKFVPASGAASRMFKVLLRYFHQDGEITRSAVLKERSSGSSDADQFLVFAEGLKNFAFFRDLQSMMADNGLSLDALLEEGRFRDILRFLLTDEGLNYADLPKGLLKFHEYPAGSRTAFEEHLIEAAFYVADATGRCAVSFTVSPEHIDGFRTTLRKAKGSYEEKFGVHYDVTFSVQDPSTDTLAVDLNNAPFRQEDGSLLFRPGGHGALLKNLRQIDADIIFIKNIDNMVPDHLKPETFEWKKITAGYLIDIQRQLFAFIEKLASRDAGPRLLDKAADFLEKELLIPMPGDLKQRPIEVRKDFLVQRLNRPVRVCGMVKKVAEPGGGPFWVEDASGQRSLQIVETGQIDFDSRKQREIFEASTHFNPVDLVCGVRDWRGEPFDLSRFVDPRAVFITQKSKHGKDLKALEHPGLWNGSMSRWITLFVEVPGITFNPVKTVNDLLRKEHQPLW